MGMVRRTDTDEHWTLPSRAIVGRGADCAVVVTDRSVSGEHASLSWRDRRWELRDLASRNGTFVDGERLTPGQRVTLMAGSTFRLAEEGPELELNDASAPGVLAVGPDGQRVLAEGGVLLLPDATIAEVAVYADEDGHWWAERADGETVPVQDGSVVQAAGQDHALSLPRELPPTLVHGSEPFAVRFRISMDEEHASMTVERGSHRHELPPRSFTYMLLTLGRQRQQDAESGLPDPDIGWMYQEDLAAALRIESTTVGVYVHRARRQAGKVGEGVARRIIERRKGTRQLRLGLPVADILRG